MTTRQQIRSLLALLLISPMFAACASNSGDIGWWQWVNARRSAKSHILSMSTAVALKEARYPTPDQDQVLLDLFRARVTLERQVRISIADGGKAWDKGDQKTLGEVIGELERFELRCSELVEKLDAYKPRRKAK